MFKRLLLIILTRLHGAHLVKIRIPMHAHSELAVAIYHPLEQKTQTVAVLDSTRFTYLENSRVITADTYTLGNRPIRPRVLGYYRAIRFAISELRKNHH